jgi:hypothetical protein
MPKERKVDREEKEKNKNNICPPGNLRFPRRLREEYVHWSMQGNSCMLLSSKLKQKINLLKRRRRHLTIILKHIQRSIIRSSQ